MPRLEFTGQIEIRITHKKSQTIYGPRYESRPNSQSDGI